MIDAIQTALQEDSVRNSALYLSGSSIGIGANWALKWMRGEINCIFDALRTKPRHTIASFVSQLGVLAAFVATGQLDDTSVATSFFMGATGGAAIDFWVNKSKHKQWTVKERAKGERSEITNVKNVIKNVVKK